jgi:sulfonate transport system substrate-binding protein
MREPHLTESQQHRPWAFWRGVGTCLLLLATWGCERPSRESGQRAASDSAATPATAEGQVSFAQIPISYSVVTHVADANHLFREAGLDVAMVNAPAGPDVVTQLRTLGSGAPIAGGIAITPVATMVAAGDTPVILATTITSRHQAKLVTFARTGITAAPASLRGKRIGVVRNTNGDIYLSRLLAKGGLTEHDVQVANGRPADLVSLLAAGQIDAAVLWDPFVAQVRRRATGQRQVQVLVDTTLHQLRFNVVTTRARLRTDRARLVSLLAATLRAEQAIQADPAKSQAETERWLSLEPGDLTDFFRTTRIHVHLDSAAVMRDLRSELEWLRSRDPGVKIPANLAPYVDGSLLRGIDPTRTGP